MKILVFLGVILLVACAQVNTESSNYFYEDFANITDSLLSSKENPTKFETLGISAKALIEATNVHYINTRIYQSVFGFVYKFQNIMYQMPNAIGIEKIMSQFEMAFDYLNMQRDVDQSLLPSEVNQLLDDFFNKYTNESVEFFDKIYDQYTQWKDQSDKSADESITLIKTLAERIQECEHIPIYEFMHKYQCHQKVRSVLPGLAHNSAIIEMFLNKSYRLIELRLDENQNRSVFDLYQEMMSEQQDLLQHIQEIKDKREAEKQEETQNQFQ